MKSLILDILVESSAYASTPPHFLGPRSKLDDIRGTPMDVGSLEEFIDEPVAEHAAAC